MQMLVIFIVFLQTADSSCFVLKPENAIVPVGRVMEIQCQSNSSNLSIKWSFNPFDRNLPKPHELIVNGRIAENFSSDYFISNHTLVINSTQERLAGIYKCRHSGQEASMQLAVIGSKLDCWLQNATVIEGQFIHIQCSINFTGRWTLLMEWKQVLVQGAVVLITENATSFKENSTVTSAVQLRANSAMYKSRFYCKVYFAEGLNAKMEFLQDNFTWTSEEIDVLYGPKSIDFSNEDYVKYPQDQLTCLAGSNPEPRYSWTDLVTGEVMNSSTLVISQSMISEKVYHFQCTADNMFHHVTKNVSFIVPKRLEESSFTKAVIAMGVLAGCIFVIVSIFVLKKYHQGFCDRFRMQSHSPRYIVSQDSGTTTLQSTETMLDPSRIYEFAKEPEEFALQTRPISLEMSVEENPVYSAVPKTVYRNDPSRQGPANGGTVYEEMGPFPSHGTSHSDEANVSPGARRGYEKSNYAAIDHTAFKPNPHWSDPRNHS